MVIIEADVERLPPAERIKVLRRIQQEKKEELERLQQEKEREIKDAESKLERSIEDLELEDEHARDEEEERKRARESQEQRSLEDEVKGERAVPANNNVTYGQPLERLMPSSLQDLSDYNLYGELRLLEEKGYLTPEEQRRVAELQQQASAITEAYSLPEQSRVDEERGHYLSRTADILQRLHDTMYDLNKRRKDAIYQ